MKGFEEKGLLTERLENQRLRPAVLYGEAAWAETETGSSVHRLNQMSARYIDGLSLP